MTPGVSFRFLLSVGFLSLGVVIGQECTFDTDADRLCGWHSRFGNDNFAWEVKRSDETNRKTGPSQDKTGGGYYMMASSTFNAGGNTKLRPKGNLARLASPLITTSYSKIFRFWYFMYGRNIGTLNVYILVNGTGQLPSTAWTRSNNRGPTWLLGEVRLPAHKTFRVIIEAVVGNGVYGDIAIDGITFRDLAYDCTFEMDDICDFTQEQGDHFDWTQGRGKTPTKRTGPNRDHTLGNGLGAYMYIEATGPRRNAKAMLVSPEFVKGPGPCMVSFFYHMNGAFIGELAVHVKSAETGKTYGKRRWQKAGNQGKDWLVAEVDIGDVDGRYQVAFEATRGRGSLADIAIDDFKLLGKQCTDPCAFNNPCQNGAECIVLDDNDYMCNCTEGWSGTKCERDFDDCHTNPCQNNGTCVDSVGFYNCTCTSGFDGENCEEECLDLNKNCAYWAGIRECERNPDYMHTYCRKSCAICVEAVCADSSPHCSLWASLGECKKNPYYMVAYCQRSCKSCIIDIDDCDPNPCKNGGICFDGERDYNCTCLAGFEGTDCENEIDECSSSPCLHGGICIDHHDYFNCSCPPGWTGHYCQIDVDECQSNPCLHGGTCTDSVNGYQCACTVGYDGPKCENDVDECATGPCGNGGTCEDGIANYTCTCAPGWTGPNCTIDFDECHSLPCQNGGTCYHGAGRYIYVCHCPSGWEGTNCEQDVDECLSNPCINGATCVNGHNHYNCTCPEGWQGRHCETDTNECESSPCQNGGSCFHSLGDSFFVCACQPGWEGDRCEIDIDECGSTPCLNGATCVDKLDSYTCECADGYTGNECQDRVFIPTTERTTPEASATSVPGKVTNTSQTIRINVENSTLPSPTSGMPEVTGESSTEGHSSRPAEVTPSRQTRTGLSTGSTDASTIGSSSQQDGTTLRQKITTEAVGDDGDSDDYYDYSDEYDTDFPSGGDQATDGSQPTAVAPVGTVKTAPATFDSARNKPAQTVTGAATGGDTATPTRNREHFQRQGKPNGHSHVTTVVAIVSVMVVLTIVVVVLVYVYSRRKKSKAYRNTSSDHFNLTRDDHGAKRTSASSLATSHGSETAVDNNFYSL